MECVAGRGVCGDRFFDYRDDYKGQITLFSLEVFREVCRKLGCGELSPSVVRRNVLTEGIDLNGLIGRTFTLQGLTFEGICECKPCYWMDHAIAPGAEGLLKGNGGLRAKILTGGTLRVAGADIYPSKAASTRDREIPEWEPLSEALLADQRATYDRMRAACPMARSPRGVTLFRHADVVAAAADLSTFSSAVSAHRQVPNSLDEPEHTAFRTAIDGFFTEERMSALEPRIRRIARAIIDGLPRGTTIDAIADIGYPLAVRAQTEWLGWQGIEDELLSWMADNYAATRSGDRSRMAAAAAAFDGIVLEQVRSRKQMGNAAPKDPTTELLTTTVEGELLPDADIVSVLRNWTAGDLGSMAAAVGVVLHFLASNPEVQNSLRANTTNLASVIDEVLRMDDPFLVSRRVTTSEAEVSGFKLERGTRVYLNWTSANRDEIVFGDPDAFHPEENAAHNLVYGTGIHVCPGRPLATLELAVLIESLLSGTTSVELADHSGSVREVYPIGGWRRVPIRLA